MRLILAVAVLVLSATLVAVTVTTSVADTRGGATYVPFEMAPGPVNDQITDSFAVPLTDATKVCCSDAARVAVVGFSPTEITGLSVMFAVTDLEESARL